MTMLTKFQDLEAAPALPAGAEVAIRVGDAVKRIPVSLLSGQAASTQAVLDAILEGADININRTIPGQITIAYDGGSGPTPPTPTAYPTVLFGTSTDTAILISELTVVGVDGAGEIQAYSGSRYLAYAQLASETELTRLFFSDDASHTNQRGAFTAQRVGSVLYNSQQYHVFRTNRAVTQSAAVTISTEF